MTDTEPDRPGESTSNGTSLPHDPGNPYRSPRGASEPAAEPERVRPIDTTVGDARALRAWRVAVVGMLILPPLLNMYSAWLLLELAFGDHPLSAAGTRSFCLAWLINLLACLGVGVIIGPGISFVF